MYWQLLLMNIDLPDPRECLHTPTLLHRWSEKQESNTMWDDGDGHCWITLEGKGSNLTQAISLPWQSLLSREHILHPHPVQSPQLNLKKIFFVPLFFANSPTPPPPHTHTHTSLLPHFIHSSVLYLEVEYPMVLGQCLDGGMHKHTQQCFSAVTQVRDTKATFTSTVL